VCLFSPKWCQTSHRHDMMEEGVGRGSGLTLVERWD
jgi:hypothetical protein